MNTDTTAAFDGGREGGEGASGGEREAGGEAEREAERDEDRLRCEWGGGGGGGGGCGFATGDAEALYKHIAEGHIGKKLPGVDMNLACQWARCTNAYTKRDHLISHLRIHVPFMPHLCPVCQRAFKRPQDLKKHAKLHSDSDLDPAAASLNLPSRLANRANASKRSAAPASSVSASRASDAASSVSSNGSRNGLSFSFFSTIRLNLSPQQTAASALPQSPPYAEFASDFSSAKRRWVPESSDIVGSFFNEIKRNRFSPPQTTADIQLQFDTLSQYMSTSPSNSHETPSLSSSLGSPNIPINFPFVSPEFNGQALQTFSNQDLISVDEFLNSISSALFTPMYPANNYLNPSGALNPFNNGDLLNGSFGFSSNPMIPMQNNYIISPYSQQQQHQQHQYHSHVLLQPSLNPESQQSRQNEQQQHQQPPTFVLPRYVQNTMPQMRAPDHSSQRFISPPPQIASKSEDGVVVDVEMQEAHQPPLSAQLSTTSLPPLKEILKGSRANDSSAEDEKNLAVLKVLKVFVKMEIDNRRRNQQWKQEKQQHIHHRRRPKTNPFLRAFTAYNWITERLFVSLLVLTNWKPLGPAVEIVVYSEMEMSEIDKCVIMSNHQTQLDWMYLWMVALRKGKGGSLRIILKESLKSVPIFGWGMQFFSFIFLSRDWAKDENVLLDRVSLIRDNSLGFFWLLVFPEGTIISPDTLKKSHAFAAGGSISENATTAEKKNQRVLIPRYKALWTCLTQLSSSKTKKSQNIPLIDVTMSYEPVADIAKLQFPEKVYSPQNVFLPHGNKQPPQRVHILIERIDGRDWNGFVEQGNEELFNNWLKKRWIVKDENLKQFAETRRFGDAAKKVTVIRVVPSVADIGSLTAAVLVAWALRGAVIDLTMSSPIEASAKAVEPVQQSRTRKRQRDDLKDYLVEQNNASAATAGSGTRVLPTRAVKLPRPILIPDVPKSTVSSRSSDILPAISTTTTTSPSPNNIQANRVHLNATNSTWTVAPKLLHPPANSPTNPFSITSPTSAPPNKSPNNGQQLLNAAAFPLTKRPIFAPSMSRIGSIGIKYNNLHTISNSSSKNGNFNPPVPKVYEELLRQAGSQTTTTTTAGVAATRIAAINSSHVMTTRAALETQRARQLQSSKGLPMLLSAEEQRQRQNAVVANLLLPKRRSNEQQLNRTGATSGNYNSSGIGNFSSNDSSSSSSSSITRASSSGSSNNAGQIVYQNSQNPNTNIAATSMQVEDASGKLARIDRRYELAVVNGKMSFRPVQNVEAGAVAAPFQPLLDENPDNNCPVCGTKLVGKMAQSEQERHLRICLGDEEPPPTQLPPRVATIRKVHPAYKSQKAIVSEKPRGSVKVVGHTYVG
ncbi:hypothetical protein HK100_000223 [Physocladia obscura]|uniref:C2H2-type domain-containing protein n=1 Tax=Physocladia obscura TaxID=109957 RepID=A0AAD5XHK7_9FUNG|nr:hypothetical protein HK100_000223 [Physocladia obscura]